MTLGNLALASLDSQAGAGDVMVDLNGTPILTQLDHPVGGVIELEDGFFPQTEWIIDTLHERILLLSGHVPAGRWRTAELNQAGI